MRVKEYVEQELGGSLPRLNPVFGMHIRRREGVPQYLNMYARPQSEGLEPGSSYGAPTRT